MHNNVSFHPAVLLLQRALFEVFVMHTCAFKKLIRNPYTWTQDISFLQEKSTSGKSLIPLTITESGFLVYIKKKKNHLAGESAL